MSSTNHTANYGLSQFLGTDKPAWLVDYNGDMSAIDTQMKANADAAAGAQTTANTADGKADTNATAISTLNTQINGDSGIAVDVTTLQGSVNTITSLIGNGEPTTTDKTIIGAINEINAEVPDLSNCYIKTGEGAVNVTGDGVKTYSALFDEIHALLATAGSSAGSGAYIVPTLIQVQGTGSMKQSGTVKFDASSPTMNTFSVVTDANGLYVYSASIKSTASSFGRISIVNDGTVTNSDYSSGTLADGSHIYVYYDVIKRF